MPTAEYKPIEQEHYRQEHQELERIEKHTLVFRQTICRPQNTQHRTEWSISYRDYIKKSGASGFCLFASEVVGNLVNEQTEYDTHAVGIYNMPIKCAWGLSLRTLTGQHNIPTRSIYLCIAFDLQFSNFLRSRKPKTKR